MIIWIAARKKDIKKFLQTENGYGECLLDHSGIAKPPTKTLFFYLVGVHLKTLRNKIEPTNCDFFSPAHWLYDYYYLKVFDFYQCFSLTLRAIKRKILMTLLYFYYCLAKVYIDKF